MLRISSCKIWLSVCLFAAVFTSSCTTKYSIPGCEQLNDPELYTETSDPFESINRSVFRFNTVVDELLFEKTARKYHEITPDSVEKGVSNFFKNLKEPRNIVASTLALNFDVAAQSSLRFMMNSTFGLVGWIDLAGEAGMKYRNFGFGHTFGSWGIGPGPYLVVPFLGPSSVRDSVGSLLHKRHTYVVKHIKKSETQLLVQQISLLDTRARLLNFTDLLKIQPDQYLFARESYTQTQLNEICSP